MSYDIAARARPRPQLGDFFTDLFSTPTDILSSWAVAVQSRGNFVTRMPSGAQMGKLGEKHTNADGTYTIQLAPANVLQADAADIAAGKTVIAADQFFDSVQPGALLKDTGKLISTGVSAVTGIPSWAIPVLLIGGGAFALLSVMHSLFPDRRK